MIVLTAAAVSLTHGVTFQCDFKNHNWAVVGNQYTCFPNFVISDENETHVTDIIGDHISEKTNADVTAFYIQSHHRNIIRIPGGIDKFFSNLIAFSWRHGDLNTLTAADLQPFHKLKEFSADGNKIISLDGDLFKHNLKLESISFANNKLKHVGSNLLDGLNDLTEANFEYNRCIHTFAASGSMELIKHILREKCRPLETTTTIETM